MASNFKNLVRAAARYPGGIGNVGSRADNVMLQMLRASAEAWEAAEAPEAAVEVEAVAAAAADVGAWPVVMALLMVLMAVKIIENLLLAIFDPHIPFIGRPANHLVRLFFHPADNATTWLANYAWNTATKCIIGFALLTRFVIQAEFPQIIYHQPATSTGGTGNIQTEINTINAKIAHINREITALQSEIAPTATIQHPITHLETRVKVLEDNQVKERHAISVLWNDVQDEAQAITQLQTEVQRLTSGLHQVHQTVVSWQDMQTYIENQLGAQGQQIGQWSAQTSANTDQITMLAPLALLLGGGARGLKTLRSLEDKPCQCPRFGGLPGVDIDALAIIEFLENG